VSAFLRPLTRVRDYEGDAGRKVSAFLRPLTREAAQRASASSSLIATAGGVHTPCIQRRTVRLATPSSLARSSCVSPVVASNTASRAWGSNVVVLSVSSTGGSQMTSGSLGGHLPARGVGVTCASREIRYQGVAPRRPDPPCGPSGTIPPVNMLCRERGSGHCQYAGERCDDERRWYVVIAAINYEDSSRRPQ
jgi:hypothetical protein